MKYAVLALVLSCVATPSFAADAPPKQPTGYEVAGCLNYRIVDGRVVELCRSTETPKRLVEGLIDPTSDRYVDTGSGTDSGADASDGGSSGGGSSSK